MYEFLSCQLEYFSNLIKEILLALNSIFESVVYCNHLSMFRRYQFVYICTSFLQCIDYEIKPFQLRKISFLKNGPNNFCFSLIYVCANKTVFAAIPSLQGQTVACFRCIVCTISSSTLVGRICLVENGYRQIFMIHVTAFFS